MKQMHDINHRFGNAIMDTFFLLNVVMQFLYLHKKLSAKLRPIL